MDVTLNTWNTYNNSETEKKQNVVGTIVSGVVTSVGSIWMSEKQIKEIEKNRIEVEKQKAEAEKKLEHEKKNKKLAQNANSGLGTPFIIGMSLTVFFIIGGGLYFAFKN